MFVRAEARQLRGCLRLSRFLTTGKEPCIRSSPMRRLLSSRGRMTSLIANPSRSLSVFPVLLAQGTDKSACVSELADTSAKSQWSDDAAQLAELAAQGDLASLGLGGWSPVGLLQTAIDSLHTSVHLPWWAAIVTATVALRVCMTPVVIKMQRNAAILNNLRPELDKAQRRIKEYQQAGNQIMAAQEMARVLQIYKKHGCNPIKLMVMPFVQFPVFISFFLALRRMATVPIESMKEGGALWFTDLTVPDPFYVLPIMACLSFMATIELGGEAGVSNPQFEKMKVFFRAMAILLIPITSTFPSAIFMYWLTSSAFSMGQIALLKVPSVRKVLGVPQIIKHPTQEASKEDTKGFLVKIKDHYRHAAVMDQVKRKDSEARKQYQQLLKVKPNELYNKPPRKR